MPFSLRDVLRRLSCEGAMADNSGEGNIMHRTVNLELFLEVLDPNSGAVGAGRTADPTISCVDYGCSCTTARGTCMSIPAPYMNTLSPRCPRRDGRLYKKKIG